MKTKIVRWSNNSINTSFEDILHNLVEEGYIIDKIEITRYVKEGYHSEYRSAHEIYVVAIKEEQPINVEETFGKLLENIEFKWRDYDNELLMYYRDKFITSICLSEEK